jgi:hypothetical protein
MRSKLPQAEKPIAGKKRKFARKEARKAKKSRKNVFNQKIRETRENTPEPIIEPEKPSVILPVKTVQKEVVLNTIEKELISHTRIRKKQKKRSEKNIIKSREELLEENEDEDRIIKKLERKLGIKKKVINPQARFVLTQHAGHLFDL